ncbi:hypothetical protein EW026_g4006 [Hermanssonia centrifuga]|uniref:Major facilitator superfamily (MFS) profile domain-containing protein n=1 Tax=Hermanssonia centrifuga TaxID=98765 RepID=A0A4S4KIY5_9APHY|nr:hypothetical protein EW026_g4006 [Hermanssonia centrifuga]
MWYPRHMLQFRLGLFWGGATAAGAFSGLLAFGISFMSGTAGMLGWSWIFILEGLATVLAGILAVFVLVDFPDTAKFLTPDERAYVILRKTIGPLIYRSEDAPRYRLGNAIELMFVGIGMISLLIGVFTYKRINAQREAQEKLMGPEGNVFTVEELRALGDRAPEFRYTL